MPGNPIGRFVRRLVRNGGRMRTGPARPGLLKETIAPIQIGVNRGLDDTGTGRFGNVDKIERFGRSEIGIQPSGRWWVRRCNLVVKG